MQIVALTGIDDERLLQPAQVVVDALYRDLAVLTFQKGRNRIGGKGLAHIFDDEFHHTIKNILLIDAVTLHDIAGDHGVVDAVDDLIGVLRVILAQGDDGEPAKPNIFLQQFLLGQCVASFEVQVLAERQGVDGDRNIATRQIGGDLTGHEFGVGAGHVNVGVRTLQQTVDRPFPAGDLLYLIQQEVTVPLARHSVQQLVIHLLGGNAFGNVHLRVPLADDMIRRHAPSQQLLLQHFENGGFTAAADARQYLDQRLVDKRRDGLDIIRPVDHGIASSQSLVYPKYQRYATSF